jgi:hypothetical protein
VDLGLFLDGYQVAIELQPMPAPGASPPDATALSARAFSALRTRQRVLQSYGWAMASVSEQEWAGAKDDHAKVHLIVDAINKGLGHGGDKNQGGGGAGGHKHGSGCGCH